MFDWKNVLWMEIQCSKFRGIKSKKIFQLETLNVLPVFWMLQLFYWSPKKQNTLTQLGAYANILSLAFFALATGKSRSTATHVTVSKIPAWPTMQTRVTSAVVYVYERYKLVSIKQIQIYLGSAMLPVYLPACLPNSACMCASLYI